MKLTIQNIKIIGEYFQTSQDFINIMMTCKKFRGLTELYESNPIQNCTLFPNITTQIFYDTLDIYQHKNSYGLLPNKKKYIYKGLTSHTNSLEFKYRKGIECTNIEYDQFDFLKYGLNIPQNVHKMSKSCFPFSFPSEITKYKVPKQIWTVGRKCFNNAFSLTEIIFENTSFYLPPFTFDCNHHIQSIILSGIDCIHQNTFQCCSKLINISIPSTVTKISDYAFDECSSLSTLIIPESVKYLGIQTFHKCSSLSEIHLPSGITSIPRSCFAFCDNLTNITYSSNIQSFDDGAFMFCLSLKHIDIPSTLTSIGACCFLGSSQLHSITSQLKETLIEIGKDSLFFDIAFNQIQKVTVDNKNCFMCLKQLTKSISSEVKEIYDSKILVGKKDILDYVDSK